MQIELNKKELKIFKRMLKDSLEVHEIANEPEFKEEAEIIQKVLKQM